MTNSVRTCLLNLSAWTGAVPPPGEECVPSAYRPRQLTGTAQRARAALYGAGADRAGMNLTLARLMAYLHASPLHLWVTADDPRVTYDVRTGPGLFGALGPSAVPAPVGWVGAPEFADPGRAHGAWEVATDGAGGYTVSSADRGPVSGQVTAAAAGDAVPLPGSTTAVVVPTGFSGTYSAELLVPPRHHFVALAELTGAADLFRPNGTTADRAHHAVWTGDGPPLLRAGAAALALAARTLNPDR